MSKKAGESESLIPPLFTTYPTDKLQCVGLSPCQGCVASKSQCTFEYYKDRRRKIAWERIQNEAQGSLDLKLQLIKLLQYGTDDDVKCLIGNIRQADSFQRAVEHLDSSLSVYVCYSLCLQPVD